MKDPNKQELSKGKAFALQYDDAEELPEVLVRGSGELAQHIIALAKEHGVPVETNTQLIELLEDVPVGEDIPPETFRLVASILSFLFHTDQEWQKKHEFIGELIS